MIGDPFLVASGGSGAPRASGGRGREPVALPRDVPLMRDAGMNGAPAFGLAVLAGGVFRRWICGREVRPSLRSG